MPSTSTLSLSTIESGVCDVASKQLGLPRANVHPGLRIIQDLNCDSLDLVELMMAVEDRFDVTLPDEAPHVAYKAVFTRPESRLSDLAELVYLQQGCGRIERSGWWGKAAPLPARTIVPFTQLGGCISAEHYASGQLFESLGTNDRGAAMHRRRVDGMICVSVPRADAMIGNDNGNGSADERPSHRVRLDGFLIDLEPVSTAAYCRFLNSIGPVDRTVLVDWCVLTPDDQRRDHFLLRHDGTAWQPLAGTERMPMVLVSWYGANAYALWANRGNWRAYRGDEDGGGTYLPSEAQWEYAARGAEPLDYPWGNDPPTPERMRFAQHGHGRTYSPETLPMADVNADLGVSPFGLRHMAGNVWQWCRDWYSPDFYATPEASAPNPVNRNPSRVRAERGGSWIGPALLCRSSYRRGRVPVAKGRCLGFRCVSDVRDI